jgi:hypothetical protein
VLFDAQGEYGPSVLVCVGVCMVAFACTAVIREPLWRRQKQKQKQKKRQILPPVDAAPSAAATAAGPTEVASPVPRDASREDGDTVSVSVSVSNEYREGSGSCFEPGPSSGPAGAISFSAVQSALSAPESDVNLQS